MDEYNIIKHIGKGSFSNVYLCKKNKVSSSLLLGFMNEIYDDTSDEFIIKEININNLVKRYVKKNKPRELIKHASDIKSVSITPYDNKLELKMQEINAEEEYYYKRLTDLIDSEIEVLHKLDNEHIIKFYSSSVKNQIYSIKMEYCQYGDLYNILKTQMKGDFMLRNSYDGFDNKFVMKYLMDTISGLKYLHDLNIIHRDIKLHNVLVKKEANEFVFKLSDFGFACFDLDCKLNESLGMSDFDFSTSALKKKYYKLCGTPYYMAPEIILNIEEFEELTSDKIIEQTQVKFYDKKVDLWSYGICLYELIFNKLPFYNIYDIHDLKMFFSKPNTQSDIYKSIDKKTIISERLKTLLKKLLTINPSFRISVNEAFEYINEDFKNQDVNNINLISDTEMLKELVNSNENAFNKKVINEVMKENVIKVPLEINNLTIENNENNNSWIIENSQCDDANQTKFPKFINSWDKINKASSLIMKISVDNNFMKWLLNKK